MRAMKWWSTAVRGRDGGGTPCEVAISLFGKMPIAPDFLRRRCLAGPGASFREWLSSVEATGEGVRSAWSLLHFVEGFPEAVIARIAPSMDATGSRRFPLALYAAVPRTSLRATAAERVRDVATAWFDLEEASRAVESAGIADLDEALDGRLVRLDGAAPPPAETVRLRALAAAAGGDGGTEGLAPRLWRLRSVLADLANRRYRGPEIPCLSLPLAAGCSHPTQAVAWLEALEPLGIGGADDAPLNIAMPAGDVGAASGRALELRLLPRPLLSRDGGDWLASHAVEALPASRISHRGYGRFESELERRIADDAPLASLSELLS